MGENKLAGLVTTKAELARVHGITSSIQTQLDAKAAQTQLDAKVTGPASALEGDIPQFDTATGKLLKDGLALVLSVGSPGSDGAVPTEQAVREAIGAGNEGGIANPLTATLNTNNHDLTLIKLLTLNGEIDDGNSGVAKTLDWNLGAAHKSTLTGNVTLAFTGYGATIVPHMTSKTAPSGAVNASTDDANSWKAFDANGATYWYCFNNAAGAYIIYQFPVAHTIIAYGIHVCNIGASAWILAGSNNGTDWTTIDTRTGSTLPHNADAYFDCTSPGSYTYYRWTCTTGESSTLQLGELYYLETATINPLTPCFLTLKLTQDATGNRTVTWPATVRGTVTVNSNANGVTIIQLYWDGTNYYVVNVAVWTP